MFAVLDMMPNIIVRPYTYPSLKPILTSAHRTGDHLYAHHRACLPRHVLQDGALRR